MTAIDPITSATTPTAPAAPTVARDALGKDAFLKLLVAQLKYQNPLSPVDGTEFIAQTAQFTMVEKLNEISNIVKSSAAANEVLEAGSMIGRTVAVETQGGTAAVTTAAKLGGNLPADASVGTVVNSTTSIYSNKGTQIPVKISFTKLADGADGSKHWLANVMVSTTKIAGPFQVDFDTHGERTSPDISLTMHDLDNIPTAPGEWDATGLRVDLGASTDSSRLRATSGTSTVSVLSQNGTDGRSVTGIVTGARFTIDGPLLTINGKEYSLANVSEVRMAS